MQLPSSGNDDKEKCSFTATSLLMFYSPILNNVAMSLYDIKIIQSPAPPPVGRNHIRHKTTHCAACSDPEMLQAASCLRHLCCAPNMVDQLTTDTIQYKCMHEFQMCMFYLTFLQRVQLFSAEITE